MRLYNKNYINPYPLLKELSEGKTYTFELRGLSKGLFKAHGLLIRDGYDGRYYLFQNVADGSKPNGNIALGRLLHSPYKYAWALTDRSFNWVETDTPTEIMSSKSKNDVKNDLYIFNKNKRMIIVKQDF